MSAGRNLPRYGELVRKHRERRGLSANALARSIGIHPTLLARSEGGTRAPDGEAEVLALAVSLELPAPACDELLAAAGYWPASFLALGPDDPALRAVAAVLTSQAVPEGVRARFRGAVADLAAAMLAVAGATGEADRSLTP